MTDAKMKLANKFPTVSYDNDKSSYMQKQKTTCKLRNVTVTLQLCGGREVTW